MHYNGPEDDDFVGCDDEDEDDEMQWGNHDDAPQHNNDNRNSFINIHDDDIQSAKSFENYLIKIGNSKSSVEEEQEDGVLGKLNHTSTLVSSLYLLRGRCYDELENRERAIEWYTK
jgi:hypothetical protein